MDVLYDLQHGVWGKGANGVMELVINVVTLALSLFVLRWTWVRRDALLSVMSALRQWPAAEVRQFGCERRRCRRPDLEPPVRRDVGPALTRAVGDCPRDSAAPGRTRA